MKLEIGQKIKAKWDGAISEIKEIKNGIVAYDCLSYKNQHLSDSKHNDGLFRDTIETVRDCFTLVK